MSRFGFYAHPGINGVTSIIGASDPQRRQSLIGIAPPTILTAVHGFQAAPGTEGINRWFNTIFPEPFRDYQVTTEVANIISKNPELYDPEIFNGADIGTKVRNGEALTAVEQELWDKAYRSTAFNLLFINQTGFLRTRPKNLEIAKDESRIYIESVTGITVEQQKQLEKDGFRYNDFIRKHLTLAEQHQLNLMDAMLIWAGRANPLLPSQEGRERSVANEMFDAWSTTSKNIRTDGIIHPVTGEEVSKGLESIEADFRLTGQVTRLHLSPT